jgi:excisionase family DNA binding protein
MGTLTDSATLTVSVKEAAKILGVSHSTLYEAVKNGSFPCIRVGHRIRISKAALSDMVGSAI